VVNQIQGQLMHCAYLSSLDQGFPTLPFLSTSEHYFEWQSKTDPTKVLGTILFLVHPGLYFSTLQVLKDKHPIFKCKSLIILWWDISTSLPSIACAWLNELGDTHNITEDIWLFQHYLFKFINKFWSPVYPYDTDSPHLQPAHSPGLPLTPFHPSMTPLVSAEE